MLPEKFHPKYKEYLEDWAKAEEVLKLTERIKNETFIPSINELRYAARRVVQAETDFISGKGTDDEINSHLTEAIENCRKARHDAIDSAINYIHEKTDELMSKVGLAELHAGFPKYAALKTRMKDIDKKIVKSRAERHRLDIEYEDIKKNHLKEVVDLYAEMEASVPLIDAIIRKQKSEKLRNIIIGSLVIGLLTSITTTLFDKRGWFDFAKSDGGSEFAKLIETNPPAIGNKLTPDKCEKK